MSLASDKRQSGAGHSNNSWRDVKTKSGKETWGGCEENGELDFTALKEKNVFLRECGLCAASSSSSFFSFFPPLDVGGHIGRCRSGGGCEGL